MLLVDKLFSGALSLKGQLEEIQKLIVEMISGDIVHASMRIFSPTTQMLERAVAWYRPGVEKLYRKDEIGLDDTLAGEAIKKGGVINLKDLSNSPHFEDDPRIVKMGLQSLLIVPLKVSEDVVGVVQLYSGRNRLFPKTRVETAERVSGLIASAIRDAIARVSLDDIEQEFLTENPSLDYLLKLVVKRMSQILRRKRVSIWLPCPEGYSLAAGVDPDYPATHQTATIRPTELPILSEVVRCPASYIVRAVQQDDRCRQTWPLAQRVGIIDTMFVVLQAADQIVGIINVDRVSRNGVIEASFSDWEERFAILFGQKAALAIHTASRIEKAIATAERTARGQLAQATAHSLLNPLHTLGLQVAGMKKSVENAITFIHAVEGMISADHEIGSFDPYSIITESTNGADELGLTLTTDSTSGIMVISNPVFIRLIIQGALQAFSAQKKVGGEPPKVHIQAKRDESDFLVTISGPVIAREAIGRIFTPINSSRLPDDDDGKIYFKVTPQITAIIVIDKQTIIDIRISNINPAEEVITKL